MIDHNQANKYNLMEKIYQDKPNPSKLILFLDKREQQLYKYSQKHWESVLASYYGDVMGSMLLALDALYCYCFISRANQSPICHIPLHIGQGLWFFSLMILECNKNIGRGLSIFESQTQFIHISFLIYGIQENYFYGSNIFFAAILALLLFLATYGKGDFLQLSTRIFPHNLFKPKTAWGVVIILVCIRKHLFSQYGLGQKWVDFQFMIICEVGGFLCALLSINLMSLWGQKDEKLIFVYCQIEFSSMLKLCLLPLYPPSIVLSLVTFIQSAIDILLKMKLRSLILLVKLLQSHTEMMLKLSSNSCFFIEGQQMNPKVSNVLKKHSKLFGKQTFEDELCCCCMKNTVDTILPRCNHSAMCFICAQRSMQKRRSSLLEGYQCPICCILSDSVIQYKTKSVSRLVRDMGYLLEMNFLHGKYAY